MLLTTCNQRTKAFHTNSTGLPFSVWFLARSLPHGVSGSFSLPQSVNRLLIRNLYVCSADLEAVFISHFVGGKYSMKLKLHMHMSSKRNYW